MSLGTPQLLVYFVIPLLFLLLIGLVIYWKRSDRNKN